MITETISCEIQKFKNQLFRKLQPLPTEPNYNSNDAINVKINNSPGTAFNTSNESNYNSNSDTTTDTKTFNSNMQAYKPLNNIFSKDETDFLNLMEIIDF